MDRKMFLAQQRGVLNLLAAIIGLGLLVALAFSFSALFASRSQRSLQPAIQPQQIPSSELISPTSTIVTGQAAPTAEREVYKNEAYGLAIKYSPRLRVEESLVEDGLRSDGMKSLAVKFYSPEAAPKAIIPREKEAAEVFADQYILVYLRAHHNALNLPLREALKQLYSMQRTVSQATAFDVIGPNLQPSEIGPQGVLMFTGSVGENPQKSVFFTHRGLVYTLTLYGGPDTGSSYSNLAEDTFDSMVSSIELQ